MKAEIDAHSDLWRRLSISISSLHPSGVTAPELTGGGIPPAHQTKSRPSRPTIYKPFKLVTASHLVGVKVSPASLARSYLGLVCVSLSRNDSLHMVVAPIQLTADLIRLLPLATKTVHPLSGDCLWSVSLSCGGAFSAGGSVPICKRQCCFALPSWGIPR